ncbi:LuxR C-terminal-related transcriptional regulator [Kutzneria sp. NPDC051319]|uniref:helix-turn-helix transcriptional regulator n=1 Tax=Kutzneria sp. NPDC051319 TaxID=3155047 RepID=UPI00343AFC57
MDQVAVHVVAPDVIASAGLGSLLRRHPRIVESSPPDVVVFSVPRLDFAAVTRLRQLPPVPLVLLAGSVDEGVPLTECRVVAVVDRSRASGPELTDAVLAAFSAPQPLSPRDLAAQLVPLTSPRRPSPPTGFTTREVEVLRLLADGAETAEIARRLTYSESTIKHVLHTLSTRHKFRNRVQAVAFALRSGVL